MNGRDFSAWLLGRRTEISREALAAKDSQSAAFELERLYEGLNESERAQALPVIMSWAMSDDVAERFDGLALIDRFQIREALPTLRGLADQLEDEVAPSARYDWAKVNRIIGRLTSHQATARGRHANGLDDYLGQVQATVWSAAGWVSKEGIERVQRLIDHGEPAEGMHSMAWIIVNEKTLVPRTLIQAIRKYSAGIIPAESLPEDLDDYAISEAGPCCE